MFSYMDIELTLTPMGEVVKNLLFLDDGSGNHVFRYNLIPVQVPITRLVLDKYIDEYLYGYIE